LNRGYGFWVKKIAVALLGVLLVGTVACTSGAAPGEAAADGRCDYSGVDQSAARVWNEVALDAIRRDFPAPTVHARNLYHLSALNWDLWSTWDESGTALFPLPDAVPERASSDIQGARQESISFAAHRLLAHRYQQAVGATDTLADLDRTLAEFCTLPALGESIATSSPAGYGIQVADALIAATRNDGSRETSNYDDFSYSSVNPPLVVDSDTIAMVDPARWQPLSLSSSVSQNGIALPAGVQSFIGPSWGFVTPFALTPADNGVPIDPGAPPTLETDPDLWFEGIVETITLSSQLAVGQAQMNVAPDGINPESGEPYAEQMVDRADYLRAIAEFWADGPDSETPPGHWNTIANEVGDLVEAGPSGLPATFEDRLEWDVKLHLAVNGATHDAAIAGWGTKAFYDYVRPISMVRWASSLGQSSDASLDSYNPAGLRLIDGLTRLNETGEVEVRAWLGPPNDPIAEPVGSAWDQESVVRGVGWIAGTEWTPYQRPDFVSPAFAAYVSGHSIFSSAAAEVLTQFTGSPYFPGGLFTHQVQAESFKHEPGPSAPFELRWDTFGSAADEAAFSRRAGGIHVPADDLAGREMGVEVGRLAWEKAESLF